MDELAAKAVSPAHPYRLFPARSAVRRAGPTLLAFEPIAAVLDAVGTGPGRGIPAIAQAMAGAMDGHIGLLLQLLFELSRSDPNATAAPTPAGGPGDADLPLVAATWISRWPLAACAGWTRSCRCRPWPARS